MESDNPNRVGSKKQTVDSDRLLLVEGKDEVLLLEAVIRDYLGAQGHIQVMDAGGKDQFPKRLQAIRTQVSSRPNFQALGVIRDADNNPRGAFQSVCDQLRKVGYGAPNSHGTFSNSNGPPSIGVFIAPSENQEGAIETLCVQSVQDTAAGMCVEEYLKCLENCEELMSSNRDKSFAHAYLAAWKNPVARVGEGAQSGVWNLNSPAFQSLEAFVRELGNA